MNTFLFFIYGLVAVISYTGSDAQEIQALIEQYNEAGEQQNAALLKDILSPDFRVLFNDASKDTVSVISRESYLQLIGNKALGGEKRRVSLRSLTFAKRLLATADIQQMGSKNTLFSHMSFVRQNDNWRLAQVLVFLE